MKTKIIITLFTALLFISCNSGSQKESTSSIKKTTEKQTSEKLHIYYFYGSHRCPTCNAVEENLKKLITENFATQIKDGSLAVSYLNWQESANEALVEKYQIYSSSLILVKYIDGKEETSDLTEFAFAHARKQPDFFRTSIQDSILKRL
jgi:thioredoxin-related protein